jgi:tRNA A37 threonylcarbamoyltransferase TsaD
MSNHALAMFDKSPESNSKPPLTTPSILDEDIEKSCSDLSTEIINHLITRTSELVNQRIEANEVINGVAKNVRLRFSSSSVKALPIN